MKTDEIFSQLGIEAGQYEDLHISRAFSAFVAVSEGRVVAITEPYMEYCPLVKLLYPQVKDSLDREKIKASIKEMVEMKISKFGHFTSKRILEAANIAVPYGASEMLMYTLGKKVIDAAVVVCDGAGTVITDRAEVVQGIGARMNGLFYTSPIDGTISRLRELGANVPFAESANINQVEGAKEAAKLGYKKIAVTINTAMDDLSGIRAIETEYGAEIISMVICTTGIDAAGLEQVEKYADLLWSCASGKVRELGKKAIMQLSQAIPVFVMTAKGIELAASYSDAELGGGLDAEKQYLVSGTHKGKGIRMGNFAAYLSEQQLPIRSSKEPRPLT